MPYRRVAIGFNTTLLAANATATTAIKNASDFKTVRGLVIASHASAANGFKIEQSSNGGTDWDFVDEASIAANTVYSFEYKLYGTHIRASYKNGGTLQTFFRVTIQMVE